MKTSEALWREWQRMTEAASARGWAACFAGGGYDAWLTVMKQNDARIRTAWHAWAAAYRAEHA